MTDQPASSSTPNSKNWQTWGLRPIVLFAAAYTIIGILHESAHAVAAYALKVPSTLFHLHIQLDRADGTLNERAVIRVAGPLFCVGLGLVCWYGYKTAKGSRAKLLLLYLAWFGVGTFFGNLMSTPFVGDFSALALALRLPMSSRYVAGLVGLLTISSLSFFIGTELRRWAPAGVNVFRSTYVLIVLPAIVGTAIAIVIFLPMSSAFATARVGESAFWIFAAVSSLVTRKQPAESTRSLGLGWLDLVILFVAVLVVRVMATGITLAP